MCFKLLENMMGKKTKQTKQTKEEPISQLTLKLDEKINEFIHIKEKEEVNLYEIKTDLKEKIKSGQIKVDRKTLTLKSKSQSNPLSPKIHSV
jgi:predicted house-cleaning noncanonical NTP pyrophosphatase (MazG superfamily)